MFTSQRIKKTPNNVFSKKIVLPSLFFLTTFLYLNLLNCNLIHKSNTPEKGKFEIINIEQVQMPINNLLKNGFFNEWLSGSRVPSGFLPPFSKYSYVLKKSRGTSGYDVVQKWNQSGDSADVNTCFRVTLYDLVPNKKYKLSISATLLKGPKVEVGLWVSDTTGIKQYKVPLLTISGEENKKSNWETEFTVESKDANYILAVYAPENLPQIIWHQWVLTEE